MSQTPYLSVSLCVLASLAPGVLSAQEAPTITLEAAISLALEKQPSLQQVEAQIELAKARKAQVEVAKRPQVTASALTSVDVSPPRTASDPVISPRYAASADLRWLLYDFGKTD